MLASEIRLERRKGCRTNAQVGVNLKEPRVLDRVEQTGVQDS